VSAERLLYEARDYPVFQNRMYDSREEARSCPRGDIRLVHDLETGLVHNAAFRPELLDYDPHYQNEQGVSAVFRQHLDEVAAIVERTLGARGLVEVGCGKGTFVELLAARGLDVTGFDPAYEGQSTRIVRRPFDPSAGMRAEGLVLRHVLEHIRDPFAFLCALRDANGGGGRVYVEVPCFDWICERRAWFDVFYEHVNYFRIADFRRMFGDVREAGHLFGGQYLYAVAELGSLRSPRAEGDELAFPADFTRGIDQLDALAEGPEAVWGGASKGTIFALLRERRGRPVQLVVDVNPAKQGKFLPATGIEVLSPDDAMARLPPGATVYVMNSNYLDEIKTMSHNRYRYIGIDQ
jgi:hypothetical protein